MSCNSFECGSIGASCEIPIPGETKITSYLMSGLVDLTDDFTKNEALSVSDDYYQLKLSVLVGNGSHAKPGWSNEIGIMVNPDTNFVPCDSNNNPLPYTISARRTARQAKSGKMIQYCYTVQFNVFGKFTKIRTVDGRYVKFEKTNNILDKACIYLYASFVYKDR
ncbi:hypothetical protein [Serratia rubidaea]|uniref:hypothetical protein n=1 Tax=Serratia rubidaea TaxID=61652 RepID=UPI00128F58B7|nr:hypothetical protein [Serratia rubidaea]QPR65037.1 hypothetical protein I6G83_07260 [Serratia rubidaea]HAY0637823.1 hypothetical protein [Serratia rubidaea]